MPEAIQKADEMGLDIRSHRSRAITAEILRSTDLALVMEDGQKEALQVEFPFAAQKIYLLTELCAKVGYSIPDPVKEKEHKQVAAEICQLINAGFEAICAKALGNEN
jgi:protein-tyrosine-phosphatase